MIKSLIGLICGIAIGMFMPNFRHQNAAPRDHDAAASAYSGKQWPWNQSDAEFKSELGAMTASSEGGNDASLRDLFWIHAVLDTERAEYYDDILERVYQKRGRVGFGQVLSHEPSYVRVEVLQSLQDALSDDELNALLKETDVKKEDLEEGGPETQPVSKPPSGHEPTLTKSQEGSP